MHILVTGGAGFIGSFLVDALIERGDTVRIFDNLEEQVHPNGKPEYLNPKAEFVPGDVRDIEVFRDALKEMDAVIHCASAVGVGQSQYEIKKYTDINVGGTANLLQLLIEKDCTVKRILIPTSMTSYGEGLYRCTEHGDVRPGLRPVEQLEKHDWEPHCPVCKKSVEGIPIREDALRESGTVYALSKNMQEDMVMNVASVYGMKATAFRLFNVYGPRQSLSNPYTGVTAIFLSRLKNNQPPIIYEDGKQSRDFISVHDVVRAFLLALNNDKATGQIFNIGSGKKTSIADIASTLSLLTGIDVPAKITAEFRKNDVRHCFADTTKAQTLLGWSPKITFEQGMRELVEWGKKQEAKDTFTEAESVLKNLKLQS
jgi:dTDP-L-rhamnose 4-epimerase